MTILSHEWFVWHWQRVQQHIIMSLCRHFSMSHFSIRTAPTTSTSHRNYWNSLKTKRRTSSSVDGVTSWSRHLSRMTETFQVSSVAFSQCYHYGQVQTLNATLDDDTVHRHHRVVRSQESSLREIFRSNHIEEDDSWKVDTYENSNFLMRVVIMETTTEASMTRIQQSERGVTFHVDMSRFLIHDRRRSIYVDDIHMSHDLFTDVSYNTSNYICWHEKDLQIELSR